MDVLIIRPGALGDTLMLAPALADLLGKVNLTFAGRDPGLYFIRPLTHLAMDVEGPGWHRLFSGERGGAGLPVSGVETAVAFFNDPDGMIANNLRAFLPRASVHLFRSLPPAMERIHVAGYVALCLKRAGLPVDPARSMELAKAGGLSEILGPRGERRMIVFHPGSGSPEKNHAPEFWVRLFRVLSAEPAAGRLKPVFLLGPAEDSLRPYFEDVFRRGDVEILVCPEREELVNTLGGAALFIGHDSGVTHLSAMLGAPTIALFRNTDPVQWHPLGPGVAVIKAHEQGRKLIERAVTAAKELFGKD